MGKRVLLLVIDALASRAIVPAIAEGRLPTFAALAERGQLRERCTSIFPSITPAATASIVTGKTPRQHGIAGAFWYDSQREKCAYYGSDFWVILKKSVGEYFHEFLVTLNEERLKAETLYETIARKGRQTACINYMWFRGHAPHEVNAPLLLKLIPGVSFEKSIGGPTQLFLADFVANALDGTAPAASGGTTRRFGFHDDTTSTYLLQLARHGLPDFTLAYFPNNDFDSHERGPLPAVETVEGVDAALAELFAHGGGLDEFLKETAVVIVGDHGQSDLNTGDKAQRTIDLDDVCRDYSIRADGRPWQGEEELMVCPNMRAAQFYFRDRNVTSPRTLVERLLAQPSVDQAFWREPQDAASSMTDRRFVVATADRGRLEFWAGEEGPQSATDEYGNAWSWCGDLTAVDAHHAAGRIEYGAYPNALARIAEGFSAESGDVWATARLGFEFRAGATTVNSAGSHGSLHEHDSNSPIIAAGLPADSKLPARPRLTDIAPCCLSIV